MTKYTKDYLGVTAFYVLGVSVAYFIASSPACCATGKNPTICQQKEKVKMSKDGYIDVKTLKNLIDTKAPVVILDARNKKWDDGRRIPGGRSLPFDSDTALITQVVPDKDALVVVYCGSNHCPAGNALKEKMISEGYTHVLEYAGGMKEWGDEMNYSVESH